MHTHTDKAHGAREQRAVGAVPQRRWGSKSKLQGVDAKTALIAPRSVQEKLGDDPQAKRVAQLHALAETYSIHPKQVSAKTDGGHSQTEKAGSSASSGKAVIQRIVEEVQARGNTYYRSSFSPAKYFATKAEAQAHEDALIASNSFPSHKKRSPTAFTFAQTPSGSSIGTGASRQGPHVFGEAGMNQAFGDMNEAELRAAAGRLPSPSDTRERFDREMADLSDDDERQARVARFDKTYQQLYGLAQGISPGAPKGGSGVKARNALRNVVKMAANMTAHGTYGYQLRNPKEHEDWPDMIKGKGERGNASVKRLYDHHVEDLVRDEEALEEENEMRRGFLHRRKRARTK